MTEPKDPMKTQSLEFTAFAAATVSFDSMCKTPIVDDDYPQVRHRFEQDLTTLIAAMRENERFGPANPYKIYALPAAQQPMPAKESDFYEYGEELIYDFQGLGAPCRFIRYDEGWLTVGFGDGSEGTIRPSRVRRAK